MRQDVLNNPIVKHSIEFSLMIISFTQQLEQDKHYVIAKQLLRSGTSIGASVLEAQAAESRADFIHKLKIAEKEGFETWYWLLLCQRSDGYKFDNALMQKLEEITKLLYAIIRNSKLNSKPLQ